MYFTYQCLPLLFVSAFMFVASNGYAQLKRFDESGNRIESNLVEGVIPTPELVSGAMFQDNQVELSLLEPLKWELEKIQAQDRFLGIMISDRETKLEELTAKLLEVDSQLISEEIMNEADFVSLIHQQRDLNLQLTLAETEIESLKSELSSSTNRTQERAALEGRQAEVILDSEMSRLKSINEQMQRIKLLHESGSSTKSELLEIEAALEKQKAKIQLAELNLQKTRLDREGGSVMVDELRKSVSRRDQLIAELKDERFEKDALLHCQRLLISKQRLRVEHEALISQLTSLSGQKASLELEKAYLAWLLDRYNSAYEKKKAAGDADNEKTEPR